MSLPIKRLFYAKSGNAILEYGFVAVLILLVVLPGLYLAGGQLRQWLDGLKFEMTSHRDQAIETSQRVLEAKANVQPAEYYQTGGNLPVGTNESKYNQPWQSDTPQVSGSNGTKRNTPRNKPKRNIVKRPPPIVEVEEEEKPTGPWCSQVVSGNCLEATGKPGIARRVYKVATEADAPTKPADGATSYLPWCSAGKSGPCKMIRKKAPKKPAAAKTEQEASHS